MEEIQVNYESIKALLNEISGTADDEKIVFRGFLTQKISNRLKYDLTNYGRELVEILNDHEKSLNEIFEKYGEESEYEGKKVKMIPKFTKDENGNDTEEITENFKNFSREFEEVSSKVYTTKFNKMTKDELDFKSEEYYPLIYQFLVTNEPQ